MGEFLKPTPVVLERWSPVYPDIHSTISPMSAALVEDCNRVNLDGIPLCALTPATRILLSNRLNTLKLIPSEDNYLRDWRGLAELAKVTVQADSTNPTDSVINAWGLSTNEYPRPTLGNLLTFLGQIDRWDVFDDLKEKIENDGKEYIGGINRPLMPSSISERDIITSDDLVRYRQGLPLLQYDAFFLYVDEDADFANSIVSLLESNEFNLRLCLKDRDLVGGIRFEHDAIMRLIASRCSHLIVIISKHFIDSQAHKFFFKYAEALSIDQGSRKIVPCVHNVRAVEVPPEFKFYFLLDFKRSNSLRNFCVRLRDSIKPQFVPALPAPSISMSCSEEHRCTIEEISSEAHSKLSLSSNARVSISSSSSEVMTQVVQMPDPSAFLSPEKSKLDLEVGAESSSMSSKQSVSKPVSPAIRIKNIFKGSKSSATETTSNKTAEPKAKKKNAWFTSKKKIAVAES